MDERAHDRRRLGRLVDRQLERARRPSRLGSPASVVERGDVPVGRAAHVVLSDELGTAAHLERAPLASQDPQDVAGVRIDLVGGVRVASRDQPVPVGLHLERVDVGSVERDLRDRLHRRGVHADVAEAVPFPLDEAGLDVDLLHDVVDGDPVSCAVRRGQVPLHRPVGDHQRCSLWRELELVQVGLVAVPRPDDGDEPVRGVVDQPHAEAIAGEDDPALPPGEDRVALVLLDPEVGCARMVRHRPEPDQVSVRVVDGRAVCARAGLHSEEDVAGGRGVAVRQNVQGGRQQVGP